MSREQYLEAHMAVCSRPNTRHSANGTHHGGYKRNHARWLWKQIINNGLDPATTLRGTDVKAKLGL